MGNSLAPPTLRLQYSTLAAASHSRQAAAERLPAPRSCQHYWHQHTAAHHRQHMRTCDL
jgi:hypothetical protein